MTDVVIVPSPVPAARLVGTDGSTMTGDGSLGHAVRAIGGGAASLPFVTHPASAIDGTTPLVAGKTNVTNIAAGGAQKFTLPAAASVPNGTELVSIFLNAQAGSSLAIMPAGADTINTFNGRGGSSQQAFASPVGYGVVALVSDGVGAWWEVVP